MKSFFITINFLLISMICFTQEKGTYTDPRDGKVYKTVKAGTQTWLAENFAFKPDSGNYQAYNQDTANINKFGYLYDWETANKVAPSGWHLPTNVETDTLIAYINRVYKQNPFDAMINGGSSGFDVLFGGSWSVGKYGAKGFVITEGVFKDDGYVQFWTSHKSLILKDSFFGRIFGFSEKEKRIFTGNSFSKCGHYVRLIKD